MKIVNDKLNMKFVTCILRLTRRKYGAHEEDANYCAVTWSSVLLANEAYTSFSAMHEDQPRQFYGII